MRNVANQICAGQLLYDFGRLVKGKFTDLEFQQFARTRIYMADIRGMTRN